MSVVEKIGEFSEEVITLLNLDIPVGTEIYIGITNVVHMAQEHRYEFNRFYDKLPLIIAEPDYVRLKQDDGSIEFVKLFNKFLKLAVRVAGDSNYYARSLYFIETDRVMNLVKKGELKRLTKL